MAATVRGAKQASGNRKVALANNAEPRRKARYSAAQQAAALAMYVEKGPAAVKRELGVPLGTVSAWARKAGVTTDRVNMPGIVAAGAVANADWRSHRARMAEDFAAVSAKALAASSDAIDDQDATTARGFMITAAVGVDKADQLSGVTLEGAQSLGRVDARAVMQAVAGLLDQASTRVLDVTSTER